MVPTGLGPPTKNGQLLASYGQGLISRARLEESKSERSLAQHST